MLRVPSISLGNTLDESTEDADGSVRITSMSSDGGMAATGELLAEQQRLLLSTAHLKERAAATTTGYSDDDDDDDNEVFDFASLMKNTVKMAEPPKMADTGEQLVAQAQARSGRSHERESRVLSFTVGNAADTYQDDDDDDDDDIDFASLMKNTVKINTTPAQASSPLGQAPGSVERLALPRKLSESGRSGSYNTALNTLGVDDDKPTDSTSPLRRTPNRPPRKNRESMA